MILTERTIGIALIAIVLFAWGCCALGWC
jgi:hypothetical protein